MLRFPAGPSVMLPRREALGLSRSHVAIATNRGEEMVRRWERGVSRPSRAVMVVIAQTLDLTIDALDALDALDELDGGDDV